MVEVLSGITPLRTLTNMASLSQVKQKIINVIVLLLIASGGVRKRESF